MKNRWLVLMEGLAVALIVVLGSAACTKSERNNLVIHVPQSTMESAEPTELTNPTQDEREASTTSAITMDTEDGEDDGQTATALAQEETNLVATVQAIEEQTATAQAEEQAATAQAEEQTAIAQAEEQTTIALIVEQTAIALAEEQAATAQAEEQTAIAQAATATAQAQPIMAFASQRGGQPDIFAIDTIGEIRRLTNDPANDSDPAWSPDGTQIVLESGGEIFVMNADGSNQRQLTSTGGGKNNHHPVWSSRNVIAFHTNRDGNWEIYVVNADGSGLRNMTNTPQTNEVQPAWSPDGNTIAFAAHPKGPDKLDIYVMDSNGTNLRQLTNHPNEDALPCWSPDGQYIAFTSKRDGTPGIYVTNVNGTTGSEYRLTTQSGWDSSWSWDGRIAFSCDNRICAVNENGGNLEYLTEPGGDMAPSWRP